jgi:hypothetical protein
LDEGQPGHNLKLTEKEMSGQRPLRESILTISRLTSETSKFRGRAIFFYRK